jgi:glutathione S-transferase
MACIEKALPHELAPLEFGAESHRACHPFLKMPALEHEGVQLFETLAITSYLDAIGPGPSLRPPRPKDHAVMLQWISVAMDYLYPDLVGALLDSTPLEDTSRIIRALDALDGGLRGSTFFAGDSISLADLFIAPIVGFATQKIGIDSGARRGLRRWWEATSARASYRETAA